MKKIKRAIIYSGLLLLIWGGSYILWRGHQSETAQTIDVDQLKNIKLRIEKNAYVIEGEADLGRFERVANYTVNQKGTILYINIDKYKALFRKTKVYANISQINLSDSIEKPEEIYLVSGESIQVKYPKEKNRNYLDLERYEKKRQLHVEE